MLSVVRSVLALSAGLVVALVLVVAVEGAWAVLYPMPDGQDAHDCAVMQAHIDTLPATAYVIASAGWTLTTFLGAWIATRLGTSRHPAHGLVLGLLLLAGAIMNMFMLTYPIWFCVANLVLLPAGFLAGSKLGQAPPPQVEEPVAV